jgi:hypothetical protein
MKIDKRSLFVLGVNLEYKHPNLAMRQVITNKDHEQHSLKTLTAAYLGLRSSFFVTKDRCNGTQINFNCH